MIRALQSYLSKSSDIQGYQAVSTTDGVSTTAPSAPVQIGIGIASSSTNAGSDSVLARANDDVRDLATKQALRHSRGVYISFWGLGAGILLSWNILLCTLPLLISFFPVGSVHRNGLPSYLSTVFCFGNLVFLGTAQRDVDKILPATRLHWSLLLLFAASVLIAFPILPLILPALSASSSPLLLPILLLTTLILSISCSFLQSAVFALAALWGSQEVLAVMSGQGGIAVLVSGTQCIMAILSSSTSTPGSVSTGAPPPPSMSSSAGLWALGALGAVGCIMAEQYLIRHAEYREVMVPFEHRKSEISDSAKATRLMQEVFRKNFGLELAAFWTLTITLSIFPPITTIITSVHNPPPRLLQPPIFIALHFLIFNTGDFVGRTYFPPLALAAGMRRSRIVGFAFARTMFPALFLMCHISTRPSSVRVLINSDIAFFLILFAFGSSNGFITSMTMIHSSSPTLNPAISDEEKDIAGTLTAFCLVAGLAGGSLASFFFTYLVSGGEP